MIKLPICPVESECLSVVSSVTCISVHFAQVTLILQVVICVRISFISKSLSLFSKLCESTESML